MKLLLISIAALLIPTTTIFSAEEATRPNPPPRAAKKHMKGMDLYSWHDAKSNEWTFAVMRGLNEEKSTDDILQPKNAIRGLDALKLRLGSLAVGEYVTWNARRDPKVFSLPPEKVIKEITDFSAANKLELHIAKPKK